MGNRATNVSRQNAVHLPGSMYLLVPKKSKVDICNEDIDRAAGTWTCSLCGKHLDPARPVDVRVENTPGGFFDSGFGLGLNLIHREFLESIPHDVTRSTLHIGRVNRVDGTPLEGWHTLRTARRRALRGDQEVTWWTCVACRRDMYFATGRWHLLPTAHPDEIVQATGAFLLVSGRVLACIKPNVLKTLYVKECPVLEKPLDGLGPIEI